MNILSKPDLNSVYKQFEIRLLKKKKKKSFSIKLLFYRILK